MSSSTALCAVVLLACALTFSAAQTSCKGRCGTEYYRGFMCQCDYNCLPYGECCKDYESQCTTKNSCKGRCGEVFKRGRLCSCDPNCMKYKQCCSDFEFHCDAEVITTEEISGAASATAPGKTNSCNNVNDNKPKEPIPNEATEQDSTFSEGDNADDQIPPLVGPTSYPEDDFGDDFDGQVFPNDEFSENGVGDPEASPIPESTSGYGSSTVDLLDQTSTEPTQDPDTVELRTETVTAPPQTQATLLDLETTQASDSPSTLIPTTEEVPAEATDASDPASPTEPGTTPPQPTTAADHVSSQPAPTPDPQKEYSPTADTPELETVGQREEAQSADPTAASSDKQEVTTPPVNEATPSSTEASVTTGPTQGSPTVPDSQVTTIHDSPTLDPTPIPEVTTSNPTPDDTENNAEEVTTGPPTPLPDLEDPSTTVSPEGATDLPDPDAQTPDSPTSTAQDDTTDDATPRVTTADPRNVTPEPTKPTPPAATSKPQNKPDPYKPLLPKPAVAKPSSKPETKPQDNAFGVDDPRNYQADANNDTNLCSGRPVSAVTTLRNGTMVVFRGHYFWFLDRNRVPGPARGITEVWGIPSPIDTVFTRCNCQGKTYIFKGPQYWRYENDVLDPGYPKVIQTGFDGLRGHITAALSVPQYRRRRESVYFFKRGGSVQKYSYQFGTSPTCNRKPQYTVYTVSNSVRTARQAVPNLGPTLSIRSWRGFPSSVTAAVSIPTNREPEGYKYYVFSRSKPYRVRMEGERPVAAPTAAASSQSSNVFRCPKKV